MLLVSLVWRRNVLDHPDMIVCQGFVYKRTGGHKTIPTLGDVVGVTLRHRHCCGSGLCAPEYLCPTVMLKFLRECPPVVK